jgi:hypothetical protein
MTACISGMASSGIPLCTLTVCAFCQLLRAVLTDCPFPVFGYYFVVCTQSKLFGLDISLLVLGQLVVLLLYGFPSWTSRSTKNSPSSQETLKNADRRKPAWRWLKFWVALAFTALLQSILIMVLMTMNQYVRLRCLACIRYHLTKG